MWELDHKEGWVPKNSCFWSAVLEKTLESSLNCKEIKPVNPKGNQSQTFIGRTDAELKLQFNYLMWRADLLEKTLMLGRTVGRKRRRRQRMRWLDGINDWISCVWTSSWRWWRTWKPGMLLFTGSQIVQRDLVTEQHEQINIWYIILHVILYIRFDIVQYL